VVSPPRERGTAWSAWVAKSDRLLPIDANCCMARRISVLPFDIFDRHRILRLLLYVVCLALTVVRCALSVRCAVWRTGALSTSLKIVPVWVAHADGIISHISIEVQGLGIAKLGVGNRLDMAFLRLTTTTSPIISATQE
jgi:hypothetical protein